LQVIKIEENKYYLVITRSKIIMLQGRIQAYVRKQEATTIKGKNNNVYKVATTRGNCYEEATKGFPKFEEDPKILTINV